MKLYSIEIFYENMILSTLCKAQNPDDAFWLLHCEFLANGYNMDNIKMRIINEQTILPSL